MNIKFNKGEAFEAMGKYSVDFISDKCLHCEDCEVIKTCLGDAVEYV